MNSYYVKYCDNMGLCSSKTNHAPRTVSNLNHQLCKIKRNIPRITNMMNSSISFKTRIFQAIVNDCIDTCTLDDIDDDIRNNAKPILQAMINKILYYDNTPLFIEERALLKYGLRKIIRSDIILDYDYINQFLTGILINDWLVWPNNGKLESYYSN